MTTPRLKTRQDRPYQKIIIDKTLDCVRNNIDSVLVESPCGSGKSFMSLEIAKAIHADSKELYGVDPEKFAIMVLNMRPSLLTQYVRENESLVQCPNIVPVSMFDRHFMEKIAGYDKAMMIFDEAHHAAADTCVSISNAVRPTFTLGLSATPLRTDKMELCFVKTIRDAGYHRLIQDGWLSKFNYYSYEGEHDPETVAKVYLSNPEQWGKSVMYFLTEKQSRECAAILTNAGVRCDVVTGNTNKAAQLEAFDRGDVDVLINMVTLIEGFDCPDLKTVFVRDSDNFLPITQMAGRVLRLHDLLPVKNIVQSQNTGYPFTRVARANHQFVQVNGEWLAVGDSDEIDRAVEEFAQIVGKFDVTQIPSWVRFKGKGSKKRAEIADREAEEDDDKDPKSRDFKI